MNGLYVLNLEETGINNVNAKRVRKHDSNPTYLWHCRLGHIGKKRIERLHKDGLLDFLIMNQLRHVSHAYLER